MISGNRIKIHLTNNEAYTYYEEEGFDYNVADKGVVVTRANTTICFPYSNILSFIVDSIEV